MGTQLLFGDTAVGIPSNYLRFLVNGDSGKITPAGTYDP
jgi:hypothetical protein